LKNIRALERVAACVSAIRRGRPAAREFIQRRRDVNMKRKGRLRRGENGLVVHWRARQWNTLRNIEWMEIGIGIAECFAAKAAKFRK
jgi:hypothetical protein